MTAERRYDPCWLKPKIHCTRFPVTSPTCYRLATGKLV